MIWSNDHAVGKTFDKTNELYYYKYNKNRITSQGAYAQMEGKLC